MTLRPVIVSAVIGSLLSAVACGGGSGAGSTTGAGGTVSGTVMEGPVGGATVTAYAISNGAMGAPLGSATTDASGNFTLGVGNYAGPVMLQMIGGTYGIVTAMMENASDGIMDGKVGGTGISMSGMGGMMSGMMQTAAGTTGLSTAMGTFISSAMNRSGVTAADMQNLMNQLATSNGTIR